MTQTDHDPRFCEQCGGKSRVARTWETQDSFVGRRRVCLSCGFRWTTAETRFHAYMPTKEL